MAGPRQLAFPAVLRVGVARAEYQLLLARFGRGRYRDYLFSLTKRLFEDLARQFCFWPWCAILFHGLSQYVLFPGLKGAYQSLLSKSISQSNIVLSTGRPAQMLYRVACPRAIQYLDATFVVWCRYPVSLSLS